MGGSTVTLRAIHLFRMLGFSKFEVYGFDSCIIGQHHAYEQKENDDEQVIDVVKVEILSSNDRYVKIPKLADPHNLLREDTDSSADTLK